jgi:tRNA A-37 threonylcarbamoyl transferase component Bud32
VAFVEINPRYRDFLERHDLLDVARLQALQGVVISGHPNRHVIELTIGDGADALHCYLKREHRTFWHQRLANAWAGFGFVTHSLCEARTLTALRQAGVRCPDWVAAGEDDQGRAFLLLGAVKGSVGLREFLARLPNRPRTKARIAMRLAAALAQLHDAGFQHRDLYAKHILADKAGDFVFLDWQRALRRGELSWRQRWRDLATIHASLADHLAGRRERVACLRAYLRVAIPFRLPTMFGQRAVQAIEHEAQRLLLRRKVREQRATTVAVGAPRLIWLDGEAFCVTPEFYAEAGHSVQEWLPPRPLAHTGGRCEWVCLPSGGQAELARRRSADVLGWLWSSWRRKSLPSPELTQLGLLFRLQRHGIITPRLLAFGQKRHWPWQVDSFLLSQPPANTRPLADAARDAGGDRDILRRLLCQAALLLGRLHQAGCRCEANALTKQLVVGSDETVGLGGVAGIVAEKSAPEASRLAADVLAFWQALPTDLRYPTDAVRFVRAYHGVAAHAQTLAKLTMKLLVGRRAA